MDLSMLLNYRATIRINVLFYIFSPFVFPTSQQGLDTTQSPRQHPGSHSIVDRKMSTDGITLLSTADGSVYHLAEVS